MQTLREPSGERIAEKRIAESHYHNYLLRGDSRSHPNSHHGHCSIEETKY